MVDWPDVASHAQQLGNRWGIGQVLGVEQALVVGGCCIDERIGIGQCGAQRLFDDHCGTGSEQSQGVSSVQLRGSGDHNDVRPGGQLVVGDSGGVHLCGALSRTLGGARGNGDHRHLHEECSGTVRARDHSGAAQRNRGCRCCHKATTCRREQRRPGRTIRRLRHQQ